MFTPYQKDPKTYAIIGACFKVHNTLGHGFLEAVYQDALEVELLRQNITFEREKRIPIYYEGVLLNSYYQMDFFCFNEIVVELKAINHISSNEEAQLLNYLKATQKRVGLIINFGNPKLQYKRLVFG